MTSIPYLPPTEMPQNMREAALMGEIIELQRHREQLRAALNQAADNYARSQPIVAFDHVPWYRFWQRPAAIMRAQEMICIVEREVAQDWYELLEKTK